MAACFPNCCEFWRSLASLVRRGWPDAGKVDRCCDGVAKSVRDGGFPNSCDFGDAPCDGCDAVGNIAERVVRCWDRNGKDKASGLTPRGSISLGPASSRSCADRFAMRARRLFESFPDCRPFLGLEQNHASHPRGRPPRKSSFYPHRGGAGYWRGTIRSPSGVQGKIPARRFAKFSL